MWSEEGDEERKNGKDKVIGRSGEGGKKRKKERAPGLLPS